MFILIPARINHFPRQSFTSIRNYNRDVFHCGTRPLGTVEIPGEEIGGSVPASAGKEISF